MDSKYDLSGKTNEQTLAAKQRFESFQLGAGLPSTPRVSPGLPQHSHGRSHSRSHSRNTSITSITSMSNTSLSSSSSANSTNDMSTGPPKQRPNSHHRRRSSVSTRRESAELMGVSVPNLPASKPEDNINLGDKDSIRRRALWALEGKPDVSYSKVEIPELVSPQIENSGFNFPTRPSYPAGTGTGVGGGLNTLAGKRDSVGKYMGSISSKDQLHTLVEEEEEEEEDENAKGQAGQAMDVFSDAAAVPEPTTPTPILPIFAATKPLSTRPRPASLNLRPLALTSGSIINQANGLPTPTLTPATKSTGLKSLSLTTSPCLTTSNNSINDMNSSMTGMRRQSLVLSPEQPSVAPLRRRPSLNIVCDSPSPLSLDGMKRQSSISYKSSLDNTVRNSAGLPTPIATPVTSERKESFWSGGDELMHNQRPLSASEQHFLFKSHNALLARITDLESALSCRSRSRPVSTTSDISSNATSEPSDEMLSLIADLKAERDELKRDVDGWRTRVVDLEDKVGIFTKRVEVERREAWVARSRLGLLEVEKSGLEKSLEDKTLSFQEAVRKLDAVVLERDNLKADNEMLQEQVKRGQKIEEECMRLQAALEKERQLMEDLERTLDHGDLLATPTPETSSFKRQMFRSMDSEASLTDVDPLEDTFTKGLTLKSVIEEEEARHIGDEDYDWEDNGLAGYEDEEDSDISFESPDGSFVGSDDDYPRADLHVYTPDVPSLIASGASSASASPTPTLPLAATKHAAHNSLSKTWTFPSGRLQAPPPRYEPEEVDRFFGCLDDLDTSPAMGFMAKAAHDKSLFSRSVHADIDSDDEMPPFVLPSHVGVEVEAPMTALGVVLEEEEEEEEAAEEEKIDEDFDGVEIDGGIRFIFNTPTTPTTPIISITPPFDIEPLLQQSPVKNPTAVLAPFDEDEEEAKVPFTFSKPKSRPSISSSSVDSFDSDMSFSARNFSPSSIPRRKSLKSSTSSPPPKTASTRFVSPSGYPANSFGTPPSKRGGTMPSMIPQPVVSPLKMVAPLKPKPAPILMRKPPRKSVPAATLPSGKANANDAMNAPSRFSSIHHNRPSSQMTVALPEAPSAPSSSEPYEQEKVSSSASSFPSIMSFQTLTNWWSPGSTTATGAESVKQSTPDDVRKRKGTLERKYVSKERQLEKLRSRLEQERRANCRGHLHVDVCRACVTGEVSL